MTERNIPQIDESHSKGKRIEYNCKTSKGYQVRGRTVRLFKQIIVFLPFPRFNLKVEKVRGLISVAILSMKLVALFKTRVE